jgi:hypothetical protein
MRCPICGKMAVETSELCRHHESARISILAAYQRWIVAYGSMDWAEYLHKIGGLEESGEWTKEVARHLALQQS